MYTKSKWEYIDWVGKRLGPFNLQLHFFLEFSLLCYTDVVAFRWDLPKSDWSVVSAIVKGVCAKKEIYFFRVQKDKKFFFFNNSCGILFLGN